METLEANRHKARRQTLKTVEHLREARQKLALADEHLRYVTTAGGGLDSLKDYIIKLHADFHALYLHLDSVFNTGVNLAHEIKAIMDNPEATPPPIVGRFLNYTDRTPLQRALIREGYEEIAKGSFNALPETYHDNTETYRAEKPARIVTDLNPPKLKKPPRPKKRNEMPL